MRARAMNKPIRDERRAIARIIGKAAGEKYVASQEDSGSKIVAALARHGYAVVPLASPSNTGER